MEEVREAAAAAHGERRTRRGGDARAVVKAARRALRADAKHAAKSLDGAYEGDAEAVHRLRVATKRAREHLRLFAPLLRRKKARTWLARLQALNDALGQARDPVVVAALYAELGAAAPPALARDVARTSSTLQSAIAPWRKHAWASRLRETVRDGRLFREAAALPTDDVARRIAERAEACEAAWRSAARDSVPERMHAFRIAHKKLRYALEAAAPLLGDEAQAMLGAVGDVHEAAGRLHDIDLLLARADTGARVRRKAQGLRNRRLTALRHAVAGFEAAGGYGRLRGGDP